MKDHVSRLLNHMFWADRRLLGRLGSGSPPDDRVLRLFSHLLASERVWLFRLRGEDSAAVEIWPALSLAECAELASENRTGYRAYLDGAAEAELQAPVTYRNSKGTEFRTARCDILTHVALHGSYHRGQIAAAVRGFGAEPVNTDYITFVREVG